jgi:hypothetical protein
MFRGRFLFTTIATLILLGLLAAAGFGLVRLGWNQGFAAGLAAEGTELTQPFFGPYFYGPRFFGGGFFSLLFGIGLFFFLGMFVLRLLFFGRYMRAWRRSGDRHPENWGPPWGKWGPGPHGPWRDGPPGSETGTPEDGETAEDTPIEAA